MTASVRRWLWIGTAGVFSLAIVATAIARLRFGVDFTDESFYVALPYEFALGNRPFVDEYAIQQTAALLLVPFVKVRLAVAGGSDGLVLYVRALYLALALSTALISFLTLRRYVRPEAAVPSALLPIAFVPASVPSLSYNTMALLLLTIGLMSGAASLRTRFVGPWTAGHVLALGLAAVAYPPIAVAAIVGVVATALCHRRSGEWRRFLRSAAAVTSVFLVTLIIFSARVRLDDVLNSVEYVRAFGVHGISLRRFSRLFEQIQLLMPYKGLLGWAVVAAAIGTMVGPARSRAWFTAALLIGLCGARLDDLTTSHLVLTTSAFALLASLAGRAANADARDLISSCWAPSAIAAIVAVLTSGNGLPASAIGILPAAMVALSLSVDRVGKVWAFAVVLVSAFGLPATLHYSAWKHVYRDDAIPLLTETVRTGPFAGLRTTPARKELVALVEHDVGAVSARGRTCVFYDDFPAGYLFSAMRPMALSVWTPGGYGFDRHRYVRFYSRHRPDVAFELRRVPLSAGSEENQENYADPLRHFFWRSGYRVWAERPYYTVYERCSSCDARSVDLEHLAPLSPGSEAGATASRGWTWCPINGDRGRAAITSSPGAVMRGRIPDFRPGTYEVDVSFYSYGSDGQNSLTLTIGNRARSLAFGPGAPEGIYRFTNIVFNDVDDPNIEIRSNAIGQRFLIVDTMVLRRIGRSQSPTVSTSFVHVGPDSSVPIIVEAEDMKGIVPGDYRSVAYTGWALFEQAGYSRNRAAVTSLGGAELRLRLPNLAAGDYKADLAVYNYAADTQTVIEVRLGGARCTVVVGGSGSSVGMTHQPCTLPNVASGDLIVTAASVGQRFLLIDAITLQPLDRR